MHPNDLQTDRPLVLDRQSASPSDKRVLMIAFHYPPCTGSSGVLRALNFSRDLPDFGWSPIVLTTTPGAYPAMSEEQGARIPRSVSVERAWAIDAGRQLAIRGRYPRLLTLPDRWISWWPSGVAKGLALIRKYRPAAIWSTFPIATAHLIALALHRVSGVPWIADFRDPMTEKDPVTGEEFPSEPSIRRANRWVERHTLRHCAGAVFTTQGAADMCLRHYPSVPKDRLHVVPNGYDEEGFREAERCLAGKSPAHGPTVLLHSGVLYPHARNPRIFFEVLADLRRSGAISPSNLKVILRASGSEGVYRSYLQELGIEDIVSLGQPISYAEALSEMLTVQGLLVFQASNCNWQVPAKIYEYLRARRPILALTDPDGDTALVLKNEGIDTIGMLSSKEDTTRALVDFLGRIRAGTAPIATEHGIARHSRYNHAGEIARLLDSVKQS